METDVHKNDIRGGALSLRAMKIGSELTSYAENHGLTKSFGFYTSGWKMKLKSTAPSFAAKFVNKLGFSLEKILDLTRNLRDLLSG